MPAPARAEHRPTGDPCTECGQAADRHRVRVQRGEHKPVGDPCTTCGESADRHRVRSDRKLRNDKRPYHNPVGNPCAKCDLPALAHRVSHQPTGDPCYCGLPYDAHSWRKHVRPSDFYAGIDGEGQGRFRSDEPNNLDGHRYVMLAWSDEQGTRRGVVEAPPGGRLSTEQCLNFILAIPERARLFAFMFSYDLAKILVDVDDETLYLLARPELRPRSDGQPWLGPLPVKWRGYRLNAVGSKFSVECSQRIAGRLVRVHRTIWDSFKFFQSKFTTALLDWKVASEERLERMRVMKDERHRFEELSRTDILDYCYEECAYMATLARKLTDAHNETGLPPLKAYHGAGSIAGTLLKSLGIDKMKRTGPPDMDVALASAFAGGRFENSRIGRLQGPIYGFDLSSAYPYQLTFLPCLECGRWEHTTMRSDLDRLDMQAAVVRYHFDGPTPERMKWGPFPFRSPNGRISYPLRSGGGWVWHPEYLTAEKHWSHVRFREAWIYRNTCRHKPFETIPHFYLERLKLGKEGPGIVIKLGCNACYGRLAQSVGVDPPFQSWIWAGLITSGTRAQILDFIALHEDQAAILMVATDGVYTWEDVSPPPPRETGTGPAVTASLVNANGEPLRDDKGRVINKPLGGWERTVVTRDMFAAKPGIYLPLYPEVEDMKKIRARGIGRKTFFENWQSVVDAFERGDSRVKLPNVSRFHAIKSSISRRTKLDLGRVAHTLIPGDWLYERGLMLNEDGTPWRDDKGNTRYRFGQWSSLPIDMEFTARPKRKSINPDNSLEPWHFFSQESAPYDKFSLSEDAKALKAQYDSLMEQPDGDDYSDFEDESDSWDG